jgi:hypothetical protein
VACTFGAPFILTGEPAQAYAHMIALQQCLGGRGAFLHIGASRAASRTALPCYPALQAHACLHCTGLLPFRHLPPPPLRLMQ